jgi:thymidylate kinase
MTERVTISLDGVDGAGKSTAASILAARLTALNGRPSQVGRPLEMPPGFIEDVRSAAELDAAGAGRPRRDLVADAITWRLAGAAVRLFRGAAEEDANLVLDRFVCSHRVNQALFGNALSEWDGLLRRLPRPDVAVLIDVDPELALARSRSRGPLTDLEARADHYERTVAGFRALVPSPLCGVDGRGRPGEVVDRIMSVIEADRTERTGAEQW